MSTSLTLHAPDPKGAIVEYPGVGILFAHLDGAPTASISGYAPGAFVIDRTNGALYYNSGTATSATWVKTSSGGTLAALTVTTLTTTTLAATAFSTGTFTATVGASTAAAGSTTADAGVLPAGTAMIYPTTAADDTTGVRIHATDQVTGRILFIGNGVANKILKIYGPSGAVINGGSANAAFSTASGAGALVACLSGSGNTWLAL